MFNIHYLHLRVPGMEPQDARRLGQAVMDEVARLLPHQIQFLRLETIQVRLELPEDLSWQQSVSRIAAAIVMQVSAS